MNETKLSLFKRGKIFYISYVDEDGRRVHKSTKCRSKSDALQALSNFSTLIEERKKPKAISFAQFTIEFLEYAKSNYAPTTANLYMQAFRHFQRINGNVFLNKITAKHWDTFKTIRLREHVPPRMQYRTQEETSQAQAKQRLVSPVTIHIELRALRAAMNVATRWQYIDKNPFAGLPQVTLPKKRPAFLTVEDAEKLLKVVHRPWMKEVIIFAINTGMRRSEILSLRWRDVDIVNRVAMLTIREDFTTKTREERIVALNDAAIAVINRCKPSKRHEYIFSLENGWRVLPDMVTHQFKKAARKAGLPEGIHMHSTRHSFASLLVGNGTPLFTVSKLLGHSNAKTSEIYSHLLPTHFHSEVGKINVGMESEASKN